jgi:hypothetical protein
MPYKLLNMKTATLIRIIAALFIIILISGNDVLAQDSRAALAAADTSRFSPNTNDGWQLFNSYVHSYGGNRATLELVIQHANNIDWTADQYVGQISYQPLQPSGGQDISFIFAANNYTLSIDSTGKCYLKLANGALPTDDPFVIPLKIFYQLQ